MTTPRRAQQEYASSQDEAELRSQVYRGDKIDIDPFPDIACSLLSSEHVQAYVRETGMIHPFYPNKERLKAASYEVNPGGRFIYWDDNGTKLSKDIGDKTEFTLPPNSISFIQLEIKFRLPYYIAARFNLRIKHVHRGLLLGTGPLVDPGFHGDLLIPLHNLTSDDYTLRSDEGLIWVEFTKTSHMAGSSVIPGRPSDDFVPTQARKFESPPENYFYQASKGKPIRSSIPLVISDAKKIANQSLRAARRAEYTNRIFVGAGILAIAGTVVGLFSFFESVRSNTMAAYDLSTTVSLENRRVSEVNSGFRSEVAEIKARLEASELSSKSQQDRLMGQINALRDEIASMKALGSNRVTK